MKKLICYLTHRKYWVTRRFLGYSDHNTLVDCQKCKCKFTLDFNHKHRREIIEGDRIKSLFETYFDGCYGFEPQGNSTTYSMGVCKLDFDIKTNTLTVHLRRPGLLIGKGGETINNLKKWLECEVSIIEVKRF